MGVDIKSMTREPRPPPRYLATRLALVAALAWAEPSSAQLLGGAGPPGLPGLPAGAPDLPTRELGGLPRRIAPPEIEAPGIARTATQLTTQQLDQVRRLADQRLLREHPEAVEPDDQGRPAVRGEILALGLEPASLARLKKAGFALRGERELAGLDLRTSVLSPPKGMSAVEALSRLKALDPATAYDFNHIYQPSGGPAAGQGGTRSPAPGDLRGLRIGLVDGSAAASAPILAHARLTQRTFAPGGARATAHATAVASLLTGEARGFHGAAPGAALYVADVYGTTAAGGSARSVVEGLAWLAQSRTPVICISLVGPPNTLLAATVRALIARGHLVVAALGNDGPAAPALYPASYPGVVAVTGVDARRKVLPEAGRGGHVDFAAPGADLFAAGLAGGRVSVRGTSFAAPIVAGRLARLLPAPDPAAASRAIDLLARSAIDLGEPGQDPLYGRGFVGLDTPGG